MQHDTNINAESRVRTAVRDFGEAKGLPNIGFAEGRAVVTSNGTDIAILLPSPVSDEVWIAARACSISNDAQELEAMLKLTAFTWLSDGITISVTSDDFIQVYTICPLKDVTGDRLVSCFDRVLKTAENVKRITAERSFSEIDAMLSDEATPASHIAAVFV